MKRIGFFLLVFLLLPSLLKADIIPNPVSAPNLRPLKQTSVQMVSEVVSVDLYKDSSVVEVLFEMKNLGQTETIEVGFPIMDFYFGWKSSLFVGQKSEGERFQAWIDNEPVENIKIYGFDFREVSSGEIVLTHKKRDILKEDSVWQQKIQQAKESDPNFLAVPNNGGWEIQPWYIWNTTFPKGETRWVKVRYSLPPGANKRSYFFNYLLHTGANWKHNIGKATVKVKIHDIPAEEIQKIHPDGYTKEGNVLTWVLKNFEPTSNDDIFIYYSKENARKQASDAAVYLDGKKADLHNIEPEDIASFSVVKKDTLNSPNGVILIHSKDFNFNLVKEFMKIHSNKIYKKLTKVDTEDFYRNYKMTINGNDTKDTILFTDLSAIEADITQIDLKKEGEKNVIIITKK